MPRRRTLTGARRSYARSQAYSLCGRGIGIGCGDAARGIGATRAQVHDALEALVRTEQELAAKIAATAKRGKKGAPEAEVRSRAGPLTHMRAACTCARRASRHIRRLRASAAAAHPTPLVHTCGEASATPLTPGSPPSTCSSPPSGRVAARFSSPALSAASCRRPPPRPSRRRAAAVAAASRARQLRPRSPRPPHAADASAAPPARSHRCGCA